MATIVCADCREFQKESCPRCEYADPKQRRDVCDAQDPACDIFQPKDITDKNIVATIMLRHLFYCEKDKNQTFYVFKDGKWSNSQAESVILNELTEIFKNEDSHSKMNRVKVTDFIKGQAMNTEVKEKPPHIICFKNGLLDINTMKLMPFDPSLFCVNQIPWDFNPSAEYPLWLKWLSETLKVEDISFLQEWTGYQFYTGIPQPAFLILIGTGQNGKSIFIDVLSRMLGEKENVTRVSLHQLTYDKFYRAELHRKLADISDELGSGEIRFTDTIKDASAGGWIEADRKNGQPFNFQNYCKTTAACNEPPPFNDESDALKIRLNVIEFPYKFFKNPDVEKGEKLATDREELEAALFSEIPGIINWSLEGLKRFLSNNSKFSANLSTEETWQFYKRNSRPVVMFNEECTKHTEDPEDKISPEEFYKIFEEWKKRTKVKQIVLRDKFFKELKKEGIETSQSRADDRRRMYHGITVTVTPSRPQVPTPAQ